MVQAAIVLIAIAATLGAIMLYYLLTGRHIPKGLAFVHGPLAIAGLVVLICYAVITTHHHKHYESIVLFSIAAVGGLVLFYKDITGKRIPKWLAVLHALLAITGFLFLLVHTMGH